MHRWTTQDLNRWKRLAHLMRRTLDEARLPGGGFRPESLGDLKRAAQLTWTAQFPTADKALWPQLRQAHDLAEEFADKGPDFRKAWAEELARRCERLHAILGIVPGDGATALHAPKAARQVEGPPPRAPWWERD